jgi:hypothetical protein
LQVKQAFLAEPALKPLLKKAMEFSASVITAHKGASAPLSILAGSPPVDELSVWSSHMEYVRKALDIDDINIVRIEEPGVADADPSKRAKDVTPGEPSITPFATVTGALYD